MTWVVGGASPFGQAFVIGDTRVTFADGREVDLLRKVYWVGRDIVAGFAGSVRIGLDLVSDLSAKLQLGNDQDGSWKPEAVAQRWSKEAAALFSAYDEREREARCSILLAAVTPRNNGPFAATVLIKMQSPRFEPEVVPRFGSLQIGSGRDHDIYREWAEGYFRDPRFVTDFSSFETGIASVLASSLSRKVAENPKPGVSPPMHIVACGRGTVSESRVPGPNEIEGTPDPFPVVATSHSDFVKLAENIGSAAAGATA